MPTSPVNIVPVKGDPAIVQTLDRDAIVIANAGAGKTTLLVEHYFELLSQGFEPASIVAFTFTEKAAREMKERIFERFATHPQFAELPSDLIRDFKTRTGAASIGTIHQFCLKLLVEAGGAEAAAPFKIIEEASEIQLRERLLHENLLSALQSDSLDALKLLKSFGIRNLKQILREYLELSHDAPGVELDLPAAAPEEAALLDALQALATPIRTALEAAKSRMNWIDFDDMERRALHLLQEPTPPLLRKITGISHLLVDEFQDTSPIQIAILEALRAAARSKGKSIRLFCVGDPKQSIYRFRKVDRNLVHRTEQSLIQSGGVRFESVDNFRSTPEILAFINRYSKKAFPDASPSRPTLPSHPQSDVELISIPLQEDAQGAEDYRAAEAIWLAGQIEERRKAGTPLDSLAVLARSSASFEPLIRELKQRHIPYSIRGGQELLDHQEVLDLLHLLEFLKNPADDRIFIGILRSTYFLVSDATCLMLRDLAGKASIFEWLRTADIAAAWDPRFPDESGKLLWIRQVLLQFLGVSASWSPAHLLRDFVERWQLDYLYASASQDPDAVLAIEQFLEFIAQLEEENQSADLGEILAVLHSFQRRGLHKSPLGALLEPAECVRLLTIHAAKGLEFDTVYLIDLERSAPNESSRLLRLGSHYALKRFDEAEDQWIPTPRFQAICDFQKEEAEEENKRLLYVALTRAKRQLRISLHPKVKRKDSLQTLLLTMLEADMPATRPNQDAPASIASPGRVPHPLLSVTQAPVLADSLVDTTVSELETFQFCAVKHRLASGYRVPDAAWNLPLELNPSDLGTLLHAALRRLTVHPAETPATALRIVGENQMPCPDLKCLEDLAGTLEAYLNSSEAAVLKSATEDYSELPFLLNLKGGRVRGQIDRLLKMPDGTWSLIDFKFAMRAPSDMEIRRTYEFQLKTYALAAEAILGKAPDSIQIHLLGSLRSVDFEFGKAKLAAHRDHLEAVIRAMRAPDLTEVRAHDGCFTCPFHNTVAICEIPQGKTWQEFLPIWG